VGALDAVDASVPMFFLETDVPLLFVLVGRAAVVVVVAVWVELML
jgi:hypothetical protein